MRINVSTFKNKAPAAFGLANALCRTLVSPWLGRRADGWDRFGTVLAGTVMQGLGCGLSIGALLLYNALGGELVRLLSLALVIAAGAVEALGAQMSYVAVKKEWVPIVFDEESSAAARPSRASFLGLKFDFPAINLTFINTSMTNIDLLAAMFGPILAGWILQVMGGGGASYSMQGGLLAIALMNIVSFFPEALLLRRVYLSCPALRQPRGGGGGGSGGPSDSATAETKPAQAEDERNPWSLWFNHPSGLPLLTLSISLLYLTALSPAGVVLTAYLVTIGMSPRAIGVFRAVGAFSGVAGISLFSLARNWRGGGGASVPESIEQLRWISLSFISMEVVSVLVATVAFFWYEALPVAEVRAATGLPWQIALFLGAVCVSRAGLYSFDIGALELEQHVVDARYRNAAGAVESALCSAAEMGIYLLSLLLPDPRQFGWQVGVSAGAVTAGGACFAAFVVLFLMHGHHHGERGGGECCVRGHCHDHEHPHTLQQEQSLREHHGYHIHLHRHHTSIC